MSSNIIVVEFDQQQFEGYPLPGSLILRVVGFANLQIMGFDPREARPGNLAICMHCLDFLYG
jgi:hypothetical protein